MVFEAEKARLLALKWHFAIHTLRLVNLSAYVIFHVADESQSAIKDRYGNIRGLKRLPTPSPPTGHLCRHNPRGCVPLSRVDPRVAWHLRDGHNVNAIAGFDKSSICPNLVRTEVYLGSALVNLNPDAMPEEDRLPNVCAKLEHFMPY